MENKELVEKNNERKMKTARLLSFLLKSVFLVSSIIFFAYVFVVAIFIQFNVDYIKTSAYKHIGTDPSVSVITDSVKSMATEETLLMVVHFTFKVFGVITVGIFLSPIGAIFKEVIKDFKYSFLKFSITKNKTIKNQNHQTNISKPHRYKLLKITKFLFSPKTQEEVFSPTMSDWDVEIFEAEEKKENWKARWICVRYTYAFLVAMWQKSPIGDLIEFVSKIAKQ